MHGGDHGVALLERGHLDPALHARALLGQHELAAGEVPPRLGEEDRDLERKGEVAVEILVQAVEVAGNILQQQWRRPRLARGVALREKRGMRHPG